MGDGAGGGVVRDASWREVAKFESRVAPLNYNAEVALTLALLRAK